MLTINRLKVMKENRAEEAGYLSDVENNAIDWQIQMVAEFISDLQSVGHDT